MSASLSSTPVVRQLRSTKLYAAPLLTLALVSCLVSITTAQTQWSTSIVDNNPIATGTGDQKRKAITHDADGNTFIAWENHGNGKRIYVQKIAPTGEVQWGENGVLACNYVSIQESCQIISDGNQGVIVTWTDNRAGDNDTNIYAQRLDAAGLPTWPAEGVSITEVSGIQKVPQLISDGQGGAILAWQDGRDTTQYDIFAQRINAAGVAQWQTNGVPVCTAANSQESPQIVATDDGSIIAWIDKRQFTVSYAQKLNDAGSALWPSDGVLLTNRTSAQSKLVCTAGADGSLIAAWEENSSNILNIYTQKVTSIGNLAWGRSATLVTPLAFNQQDPQIASDGAGGAFITWMHAESTIASRDIHLQHISTTASLSPSLKVCTSQGEQRIPSICAVGDGEAIVVWQDRRNSGTGYDVYAQKVESTGKYAFEANGKAVSKASNDQVNVAVVPATADGAIVSWEDFRATNFDIYASRISSDGTIGPPPVVVTGPAAPSDFAITDVGTALNLSWTDNATNETGYKIKRSVNGAAAEEIDPLPADTTSFSDTDINNCSVYEYTVTAFNGEGENSAAPAEHDNRAPVTLTVHGDNPAVISYGRPYYDAGASALDGCSNRVPVTVTRNTVDTNTIGSYVVDYSATGADGETLNASRTVNVVKADQTINFAALPDKTYGDAPITLTATSSAGLPVELSVSGPATLAGNVLTLNAAGSVTVTARHEGNTNYNAAPDVVRTFTINKANASVSVIGYNGTYDGQPHTATGTARGIEPTPADLTSLLHINGTFTEVPGGTATWGFDGNENYKPASGSVSIIIRNYSSLRPKPPVRP